MQNFPCRLLALLVVVPVCVGMGAQTAEDVPRLVVNVTIDQLRSDYMEAFASLYGDDGFNRLAREGRSYSDVSYPFAHIDRASAVACIVTGSAPYVNGIVGERWLDRTTLQLRGCVDDASCQGWLTSMCCSPASLGVSTVTDELKVATGGRALVFSVAPDADMAVLSAGHAADGAYWIDNASGQWCSTSYYGQYPDWALRYDISERLSIRIGGLTWTPVSPIVENFNFFISPGQSKSFDHKFAGATKISDFKTSACVNAEVTRFAQHCLSHTELGQDNVTDFLSITYYAGTFRHEPVSSFPMELQDTYVRLDMELGKLLATLEERVGKRRFLLVVTSTGYVDDEGADYSLYNIPTGTFNITRASSLLNMYLTAVYGQGQYVEARFGAQLFLNQKLIEDKQLNISDVLTRSQALLIQMSGVRDVYTSERLALSAGSAETGRLRNSFYQQRSGDIFIEVSPGWTLMDEDSGEQYLQRESYVGFPLFFFGNGIKAEEVKEPVTIDRVAPTMARFMRIRAPNACSAAPLSAVR